MTIEAVKIFDFYNKAKNHIEQATIFNGFTVKPSPDTGIQILNPNKTGITIRESWGNGQVEILIEGIRHAPASRDLQITRDSIKELFDAIDADRKTGLIEKIQIKSLVESFIKQA